MTLGQVRSMELILLAQLRSMELILLAQLRSMELILLATRQDKTFKETEEHALKLKNLINLDVLFLFSSLIL